jgi:hypothetical protein
LVVLYEAIDQILEMVRLVGHVAHKAEKTWRIETAIDPEVGGCVLDGIS